MLLHGARHGETGGDKASAGAMSVPTSGGERGERVCPSELLEELGGEPSVFEALEVAFQLALDARNLSPSVHSVSTVPPKCSMP